MSSVIASISELARYRDLLFTLAMRDIKVRYRQTFMGVAWAVLQPLSFMLIFSLLKVLLVSGSAADEATGGVPYPIFSYVALVPWMFFSNGLTLASGSVAANMNLVKKIYFPREVFPLGAALGAFMDFLVASLIVAAMMLFYRIPVTGLIVWAPLLITIEALFLMGIALFTSALNVFYRDIKYIVPLALQLGMFVTPVIYPASMVPERFMKWYMLNPLAVVIEGLRSVIIYGRAPEAVHVWLALTVSAVLFVLSFLYFKRVETKFADLI